jgi:hypothetical protein
MTYKKVFFLWHDPPFSYETPLLLLYKIKPIKMKFLFAFPSQFKYLGRLGVGSWQAIKKPKTYHNRFTNGNGGSFFRSKK